MTLPATLPERLDELLARLDRTAAAVNRKRPRRGHGDSYLCCCPAHDDKNPSLSLKLEGPRVLVHCFAGCSAGDVLGAVGLPIEAMFDDYAGQAEREPRIRWNGAGAQATAGLYQFDAAALPMPPTIQEFLDLDFPATEPLLGPLTTQQIVMLYAPPGVGKTMFALALAWAIAAGENFIGWISARRARVLVVDGEMAGEMMQRRMARAGLGEDWLRVANLANWAASNGYDPINLCEPAGHDVINVWATACGAEVVILDNLMSLAWNDSSMASDEHWQPVRRLVVQQRALGRCVVVVDHTNQAGDIFGSKTKLWHADLALQLSPLHDDPDPVLKDGKLTVPTPRFSLKFQKVRETGDGMGQDTIERTVSIGTVGQSWEYEAGREEKQNRARQMAMNGLNIRDIADELRTPKSTIGRWVKGYTK